MTKDELLKSLDLTAHVEGGYYRRTFQSDQQAQITIDGQPHTRHLMSSIFYCLTDDSPIGHFHKNTSDIMHYWHMGSSLRYWLIDENGKLTTTVLGPNLAAGEQLQLMVPGGLWKATQLEQGEFGLLSEAVSPGFDFDDMTLATKAMMKESYPDLFESIEHLCKTA